MSAEKGSRRELILQTLAMMLESSPGERITTAALAKEVGVSEAALYRHFPSKAKMYEALIEFVENTLFSRINLIMNDSGTALNRCEQILTLVITFAARNPGICRLLTGDALTGESARLRARTTQVFDRLETQLKQILRQAEAQEMLVTAQPTNIIANLLLACVEGRIIQFVRSGFKRLPSDNWNDQWQVLAKNLLVSEKYMMATE